MSYPGRMFGFVSGSTAALDAWLVGETGGSAILDRQQIRLNSLVTYARECSHLYRELYSGIVPEPVLAQLPSVTKTHLMDDFDRWVTDPDVTKRAVEAFVEDETLIGQSFLGRYAVWKSSGTTGGPGLFLHGEQALAVYDILFGVRAWPRLVAAASGPWLLAGGGRIAYVAAVGGHYAGISSWLRSARIYPFVTPFMYVFSVLGAIAELVEQLNRVQPAALVSYPSVLALLAQEQRAGRLRIAPGLVLSGGECLVAQERDLIEAVFGGRVHDIYGCSEANYIAFGCEYGWLHVNADWMILEPVDESYRPVPAGTVSHTCLLTNLANRVQPLIRYDLGDSITARPDPCPCGSPFPAIKVEGRRGEILHLTSADGSTVPILPMSLIVVLDAVRGLRRCQVIQTGMSALKIRLDVQSGADASVVWAEASEKLSAFLAAQGLKGISIGKAAEPAAVDPVSGKFRHVWSELK